MGSAYRRFTYLSVMYRILSASGEAVVGFNPPVGPPQPPCAPPVTAPAAPAAPPSPPPLGPNPP